MELTTFAPQSSIAGLRIKGRFDAYEAPHVLTWLELAFEAKPRLIVINLAEVDFIDSSALAVLVKGLKRIRERGGNLVLCELPKPIRTVFELTRLDKAFDLLATEQEALQMLVE